MPTMAPCPFTESSTWAISAGSWAARNRYIPRPVPAAGVKVIVGSVTSKAKRALPALTS